MGDEEGKNKIIFWTEIEETEEVAGIQRAITPTESCKTSGKLVELDSDEVKEKIKNIIDTFGNLMKKNSNYYVDGIEISISATAKKNMLVIGGNLTGGLKITIKPKKTQ